MTSQRKISEGLPYPLGATVDEQGINFALFSENAEKVTLCLFDDRGEKQLQAIDINTSTDHIWHVRIEGLGPGTVYGYRVHGPYEPYNGHRFNENKLMLDPYAKKIQGNFRWTNSNFAYDVSSPDQDLVKCSVDNSREAIKGIVIGNTTSAFRPQKPLVPWEQLRIYEVHVKGYTKLHMAVAAEQRGTLAGLAQAEVLSYIKSLGITAIELLPIQCFLSEQFIVDHGLTNYWGYNTLNFFSIHQGYLASNDEKELINLVHAAHDHGIEVILDVVYNHTAEGNHLGPTLSFRGIDNASYYTLSAHDPRFYVNDTGCGNTLNIKHPRVMQMVLDSLRYWVTTFGIDGFRFDLATVLGREASGFDRGCGFFDALGQDPILASVKMIAEPWDVGPGGYQLGNYPAGWSEWNDRYRDTVRRFWRGDSGMLPEFARRIHGSSDLFEHSGRGPYASVNFISSHDGFTLNDLVSYKNRHNLDNKESNNDGHHANFSDNHGEEGLSSKPEVMALRERQKRNFIATLFLSQGTPMLLAGDELGRSQLGNNNAYCQDNTMNWLDWETITSQNEGLKKFTKNVISLRKSYPMFSSKVYVHRPEAAENTGDLDRIRWFDIAGQEMRDEQWREENSNSLGWMLENYCQDKDSAVKKFMLLLLFNASKEEKIFSLPKQSHVKKWTCILDSSIDDGIPEEKNIPTESDVILLEKSMKVVSADF